MNTFKSCVPCVCTGSGRKRVCEEHNSSKLEWDDIVPLACAAYNFMPNENSRESPFFLMFARDPILPLNTLLEPRIRYMGNGVNMISLEAMKSIFELVAVSLKNARACKDPEHFPEITKLHVRDTVMIKIIQLNLLNLNTLVIIES